jgi:hypothetical protein
MLFSEYKQLQFTVQTLLESADKPIQPYRDRTFAESYGPLELPAEFADYDHIESYDHGSTLITSFGIDANGEIIWTLMGMNPMNPSQFAELMSESHRNKKTNPLYERTMQLDDTGIRATKKVDLEVVPTDVPLAQWFSRASK